MRFQIIVTPSVLWNKISDPPYGALYIASSLLGEGHEVRIESCDIERIDYGELSRRISEYKPDAIGISSVISTTYKYVKETTLNIKRDYPHIKIIVGGALDSVAELVLKNSGTDIVVIGEGDIAIKELSSRIVRKESYHDVAGLFFKDGNRIVKTPFRLPIKDLDTLTYPAFDLIDINKYFIDVRTTIRAYRHYKNLDKRLFEQRRSKNMLRIMISRGCVGRCSFCYRPAPGVRHFSFDYIFDYIEYLMKKFGINVFSFGDECFAPSKEWNRRFLEEFRKRNLDIMFQIMGMRVNTVDRDILCEFKKAGCYMIFYGFESGSQKMLDIMEKRTTVEQNVQVARWTQEADIFTSPNFIFGMPGETIGTIDESINFLKKIGYGPYRYQYAYPLAVPGTPLYDYALFTGLIRNEEEYLTELSESTIHNLTDTKAFLNFTTADFKMIVNWPKRVEDALLRHYSKSPIMYAARKHLKFDALCASLRSSGLLATLGEIGKRLLRSSGGKVPPARLKESLEAGQRERYTSMVNELIDKVTPTPSLRKVLAVLRGAENGCSAVTTER